MELSDFAIPHDPSSVHQLHWTPGSHGKGLIDNGTVHIWNVRGEDGDPVHSAYMRAKGIKGYNESGIWPEQFWINPDGSLSGTSSHEVQDELIQIDPRLKKDAWSFESKTADVEPSNPQHILKWQPGTWGKGILFRDGSVHHWPTQAGKNPNDGLTYQENDGYPFHSDWLTQLYGERFNAPSKPEQFFAIQPDGHHTASTYAHEYIAAADPRLMHGGSRWEFNSGFNTFDEWRQQRGTDWNDNLFPAQISHIEVPTQPGQTQHRPVIWNSWSRQILTGSPGSTHAEVWSHPLGRAAIDKEIAAHDEATKDFKYKYTLTPERVARKAEYGVITPSNTLEWYATHDNEQNTLHENIPAIHDVLGTTPHDSWSFGAPEGACPTCNGTGMDPDATYYHESLGGCPDCGGTGRKAEWKSSTGDSKALESSTLADPLVEAWEGLTKAPGGLSLTAAAQELHIGVDPGSDARSKIKQWVDEQDWPEGTELEDPADYHITLLYCPSGHDKADKIFDGGDEWDASIKGLDNFPSTEKDGFAHVLTLHDCDSLHSMQEHLVKKAREQGLEPSFADDYKPHITIGFGPEKAEFKAPDISFMTGDASVSEPREKTSSSVVLPDLDISNHELLPQPQFKDHLTTTEGTTEPWSHGQYGKGFITPHGVVAWGLDEHDDDATPWHMHVLLKHPELKGSKTFWITPDGSVDTFNSDYDRMAPHIQNLIGSDHPVWQFNSSTRHEGANEVDTSKDTSNIVGELKSFTSSIRKLTQPDISHAHNWKPGNYGKFVIENNGRIHTWNLTARGDDEEDASDGDPVHGEYMKANGLTDNDLKGLGWIDQDGFVRPAAHDKFNDAYEETGQAIANLTGGEYESNWRFASVQTIQHAEKPNTRGTGEIPFIYLPKVNQLHLGQPGWLHHQIITSIGRFPRDTYGPQRRGLVDPNGTYRWYGDSPENDAEVKQALESRFGPLSNEDDEWKLGSWKTAPGEEAPTGDLKGHWVRWIHDGTTEYRWASDTNHAEMYKRLGIKDAYGMRAGELSPRQHKLRDNAIEDEWKLGSLEDAWQFRPGWRKRNAEHYTQKLMQHWDNAYGANEDPYRYRSYGIWPNPQAPARHDEITRSIGKFDESQWHNAYQQHKLQQYQNDPTLNYFDYENWLNWYAQHAPQHFDPEGTQVWSKKEDKRAKPQKCKECKRPAVKSLVWAEGMAYVPVCAEHEDSMRKHLKAQDGEGAFQEVQIKANVHTADAVPDEAEWTDVIGQKAYDEWQFSFKGEPEGYPELPEGWIEENGSPVPDTQRTQNYDNGDNTLPTPSRTNASRTGNLNTNHVITWTGGNGKWLIDQHDNVHAWDTDTVNWMGSPHHTTYMENNGISYPKAYGYLTSEGVHPYPAWVEYAPQVRQVLGVDSPDWDFISNTGTSAIKSSDLLKDGYFCGKGRGGRERGNHFSNESKPTSNLATVIDASVPRPEDSVHWEDANTHSDPSYYDNVPGSYYYSPTHNTIWYGNGWTHHEDIRKRHEIPGSAFGGLYKEGYHDWYGPDQYTRHIQDSLINHFGHDPENFDDWDFESKSRPSNKEFLTSAKRGKGDWKLASISERNANRIADHGDAPYAPVIEINGIPYFGEPEAVHADSWPPEILQMADRMGRVSPSGRIEWHGDDEWNLSSVKNSNELKPQWWNPENKVDYWGDHSVIYNPNTKQLLIGDPNTHHADLYASINQPHSIAGGWLPAAVYDHKFEPYGEDGPLWDPVYNYFKKLHEETGESLDRPGSWEFNTAWEKPDITQPPTITELTHDQIEPLESVSDRGDLKGNFKTHRQPWIYYPEDHEVVLGPVGSLHSQLGLDHDEGGHSYGAILYPNWDQSIQHHQVRDFGRKVPPSVIQALKEKYGVANEPDWEFNSKTSRIEIAPYEPGKSGKFIVWPSKTLVWGPDSKWYSDYNPGRAHGVHHQDLFAHPEFRPQNEQMLGMGWVDSDGKAMTDNEEVARRVHEVTGFDNKWNLSSVKTAMPPPDYPDEYIPVMQIATGRIIVGEDHESHADLLKRFPNLHPIRFGYREVYHGGRSEAYPDGYGGYDYTKEKVAPANDQSMIHWYPTDAERAEQKKQWEFDDDDLDDDYFKQAAIPLPQVHFPEGYSHEDAKVQRTPFWVVRHPQDRLQRAILLGHPGSEHIGIDSAHDPKFENWPSIASGAVKPAGYGEIGYGGSRSYPHDTIQFFNTWFGDELGRDKFHPEDDSWWQNYDYLHPDSPERQHIDFVNNEQSIRDKHNYDDFETAIKGAFPHMNFDAQNWNFSKTAIFEGLDYKAIDAVRRRLSPADWAMVESNLTDEQIEELNEHARTNEIQRTMNRDPASMEWVGSCPNCGADANHVNVFGYLGYDRDCIRCGHEWSLPIPEVKREPIPPRSENIQVIDSMTHPNDDDSDAHRTTRQPWLYVPQTNHVYVGRPGASHYHIHRDFPYIMDNNLEDQASEGAIGHKHKTIVPYDEDNTPTEVYDAIDNHLGGGFTSPNSWSFYSDYWDEERKKDFPEDFHEDPFFGDLGTTKPTKQSIRPWKMGQPGKGVIDENGKAHIWGVDVHGGPHHLEALQELGYPEDVTMPLTFEVGIDGTWDSWLNSSRKNEIKRVLQEQHPELVHYGDLWNFNSAYDPGPPKIQMTDTYGTASDDEGTEFEKRRPFLYDVGNHTVYVGGYNQTHEQLMEEQKIPGGEHLQLGAWLPHGGFGSEEPYATFFNEKRLKPEWRDKVYEALGAQESPNWEFDSKISMWYPTSDNPGYQFNSTIPEGRWTGWKI